MSTLANKNLLRIYNILLNSGKFWVIFPSLSGNWKSDAEDFRDLLRDICGNVNESDISFESNPANPDAKFYIADSPREDIEVSVQRDEKKNPTAEYYDKKFGGKKIDVYRVLKIFGITEPAQQHAIKKLLRAGKSIKSEKQDIDEVIDSLERWKEMIDEE